MVSGTRFIAVRIVIFFDSEARPIKKGKLAEGTEFGDKVRSDEIESGFVIGYAVYAGSPADDELLNPAVQEHIYRFGEAPKAVATDRGFGSKTNEAELARLGIRRISIPRKSKKGQQRVDPSGDYLPFGEYGYRDLYVGVPTILGGRVEGVNELELTAEEQAAFARSVESVKKVMDVVGL